MDQLTDETCFSCVINTRPQKSMCIFGRKLGLCCTNHIPIDLSSISNLNTLAAGDRVKFNLPGAFATTMLTWGLLESWDGYERAGELDNMLDSIKWELDYFIKCHTGPNEVYGQVIYMIMIQGSIWVCNERRQYICNASLIGRAHRLHGMIPADIH